MLNVSSWSIRNPTPSVLLFVLLTLLGLFGFQAMKIQNFPDIDLPMITVMTPLPGTPRSARAPRPRWPTAPLPRASRSRATRAR